MIDVGKAIVSLRMRRGYTLKMVEQGCGIGIPTLYAIERSKNVPTLDKANKICGFFHISLSELVVLGINENDNSISSRTSSAINKIKEEIITRK